MKIPDPGPYASLRVDRAAGKYRYSVETATLIRCATSLTEIDASASRARATVKSFAAKAGGLPPVRPRARAASNPARVRSRMINTVAVSLRKIDMLSIKVLVATAKEDYFFDVA